MSNNSETSQNEVLEQTVETGSSSGYFIDDYSHLRLSYYQLRNNNTEETLSSEKLDVTLSSCASMDESSTTIETVLYETSIKPTKVDEDRQKIWDYHTSQIPDLPHPAFSVASIISSASQRMESGVRLMYNDRIEHNNTQNIASDVDEFNPERRSTMKPSEFALH